MPEYVKITRWPGKKIVKVFERDGWGVDRIEGSHCILVKEGKEATLSIPVHGNMSVKVGLLKGLIRDAELKNEEF